MARLREMFDLGDDPAQLDLVATPLKGNPSAVYQSATQVEVPQPHLHLAQVDAHNQN